MSAIPKLPQINTGSLLAHTEDAMLTLESLSEVIRRAPLDSMQWFYLSAFVNDMQHQLEILRRQTDKSRPSREIRRLLVESYARVSS